MSPATEYRERLRAVNLVRKRFGRPALKRIGQAAQALPEVRASLLEKEIGLNCKVESAWIEFQNPAIANSIRLLWVSAGFPVTPCKPRTDRCVTLPKPLRDFLEGKVPGGKP